MRSHTVFAISFQWLSVDVFCVISIARSIEQRGNGLFGRSLQFRYWLGFFMQNSTYVHLIPLLMTIITCRYEVAKNYAWLFCARESSNIHCDWLTDFWVYMTEKCVALAFVSFTSTDHIDENSRFLSKAIEMRDSMTLNAFTIFQLHLMHVQFVSINSKEAHSKYETQNNQLLRHSNGL